VFSFLFGFVFVFVLGVVLKFNLQDLEKLLLLSYIWDHDIYEKTEKIQRGHQRRPKRKWKVKKKTKRKKLTHTSL